jgi:NhaP-type Na+/H+ or K+/H+ antiporter
MALALGLFTDAANANLSELKRSFHIPQKLLLIGLPLTILLGFAAGVLIFDGLTLLEVAILATILAPTDAALGKAVVTNEAVPVNIRESLNVESGLNDGICVPILFIFLALATNTGGDGRPLMLALTLMLEAIGLGIVVGVVLTLLGSWLLKLAAEQGWVTETWRQLAVPALAIACFAVAQWLGGVASLPPLSEACYSVPSQNVTNIHSCSPPKELQIPWPCSPGWCSAQPWSASHSTLSAGRLSSTPCSASPSFACCRPSWRWPA